MQQETNFVGQLYRNGNLVQAVKSPVPILLQPGQHGQIIVPVPVAKNGLYSLSGTANFAGQQSGVATITFRVGLPAFPGVQDRHCGGGSRASRPDRCPVPEAAPAAPYHSPTRPRAIQVHSNAPADTALATQVPGRQFAGALNATGKAELTIYMGAQRKELAPRLQPTQWG